MPGLADRLVRNDTALVIVDVQDRLAAAMERRDEVVTSIELLVRVAAIVGCPIVVTRQYPKGLGDTDVRVEAAIEAAQAAGVAVHRADKLTFDCFAEPEFIAAIKRSGCSRLLVCGMESHICVTQTALAGVERGLSIHVAEDGCCSRKSRAHDVAMARMGRAGVVVTVAESAAYELIGEAGTPEFKALLAAVKG